MDNIKKYFIWPMADNNENQSVVENLQFNIESNNCNEVSYYKFYYIT